MVAAAGEPRARDFPLLRHVRVGRRDLWDISIGDGECCGFSSRKATSFIGKDDLKYKTMRTGGDDAQFSGGACYTRLVCFLRLLKTHGHKMLRASNC